MPDLKHFKLPDVGEGLTEAEIVSWKVKPGDTVKVNDVIVEIETAKSLVELPCPFAGTVAELLVEEGTTVDVGTPIISVDAGGGSGSAPAAAAPAQEVAPPVDDMPVDNMVPHIPAPPEEGAVEPGLIGGPAPGGRTSVLVGYGPRTTEAKRRPRKGSAVPAGRAEAVAQDAVHSAFAPAPSPVAQEPVKAGGVLAKPPVRKLAKDLGVDLATVAPTGPGGVVTRADVEAAAGGAATAAPAASYTPSSYSASEREERVPVKGVRKMTAQAMVASAFTAPHVTEWVTVDVTRTMKLVEELKRDKEFAGVRVSPLLLVAKAVLLACRRNPGVNATWDEATPNNAEIVLKNYVNLGIAAATPRGLVVPNVKDADRMSLRQLAEAFDALVATAREGRTQPADMAGGTITITNVGVFGVDSGTPIINPGESAILAFGAVREQPWVHKGKVKVRQVTQLALSFDHRLIDGELGSRFLADVAAILENPARALVWG
ncbi:MAG: dihydrolipoamide acetyltransferase family protein [Motilibacteraceae bacterium]